MDLGGKLTASSLVLRPLGSVAATPDEAWLVSQLGRNYEPGYRVAWVRCSRHGGVWSTFPNADTSPLLRSIVGEALSDQGVVVSVLVRRLQDEGGCDCDPAFRSEFLTT